jgi:hypothetical protein
MLISLHLYHPFISLLFPWTTAWNSSLFNMVPSSTFQPLSYYPYRVSVPLEILSDILTCVRALWGTRCYISNLCFNFYQGEIENRSLLLLSFILFHVCCLFFSSPEWITSGLMKLADRITAVGTPSRPGLAGSREGVLDTGMRYHSTVSADLLGRHFRDGCIQVEMSEKVSCDTELQKT